MLWDVALSGRVGKMRFHRAVPYAGGYCPFRAMWRNVSYAEGVKSYSDGHRPSRDKNEIHARPEREKSHSGGRRPSKNEQLASSIEA